MDNVVRVHAGLPDGFGSGPSFSTGPGPQTLLLADMDRDGRMDFVTVSPTTGNVSIVRAWRGNTFLPPISYPCGPGPRNVAVGDLNGDGFPDLVCDDFNANQLTVLINTR
jgi:hypothetical protein